MRGVRKAWSFLAHVAAWSVSGSVLGTLAFSETARGSWPAFVRQTTMGVVFSSCCIGLCFVVLPALPRYARQRFRYPLNWVIVAAALVVLSFVACAIGTALLVVTGFTPPRMALRLLQEALPTSTYFTLLFGMATSFMSESKERETADARRLVGRGAAGVARVARQPAFPVQHVELDRGDDAHGSARAPSG